MVTPQVKGLSPAETMESEWSQNTDLVVWEIKCFNGVAIRERRESNVENLVVAEVKRHEFDKTIELLIIDSLHEIVADVSESEEKRRKQDKKTSVFKKGGVTTSKKKEKKKK